MALQVVWERCSVTNPDTHEDMILRRFEMLPDWVDDYTRFVLTSTGAVRYLDDSAPETPPPAEPVRLAEHPPLTSDAARAERGTLAGDAAARLAEQDRASRGGGDRSGRPAQTASKAEWVEYAVANGADRGKAEAATKDELSQTKADQYARRFGAKP